MSKTHSLILIADDSPVNLKMLAQALSNEGDEILTTENGPDARALAAANPDDLMILDIRMPGESGFETMRRLQEDKHTAEITVIFITGEDRIESKLEGFALGAIDYITKPFEAEEIKARVRLHLRLSVATHALIADQAARLSRIADAQHAVLLEPAAMREARFSRHYASLWEAGGDFYEVVAISEGIHGYFVADVSGHDLSTSFLTFAVKALLEQSCKPTYQPLESMVLINGVLLQVLPSDKYLTGCYPNLNRKRNLATVVDMGHPPVLYQPVDGPARLLFGGGDILGAFRCVTFPVETLMVGKGDRFVLYSDGLVERTSRKQTWSQAVRCLPELFDELRDVPIEGLAEEAAARLHDRLGAPEGDVALVATEV